ncbi:MAG TPA: CheR family methyltransferase [Gemmatimonadaceae bacterium]|nr:CheR family methyltransferase [Gemmatimonadaceae bacterium]
MSSQETNHEFEALLQYLKRTRGFDFTGYKRSTLHRRISKRMQMIGVQDFGAYLDYLEVHPEEFAALFDTVLINVTSFFRDPEPWQLLEHQVLPQLLERRPAQSIIRVWSAGAASGEEAYSIAMILAEVLGPQEFRDRVKIYATDVDENALNKARAAVYSERDVEAVPPTLRAKYFDPVNGEYVFKKDMRRQVIFGRHDLIQDAPISRVDVLICRNTLMYFNAEVQAKILGRFHFALSEGGVLFLGRAETLLSHSDLFAPIDLKRRLSMKLGQHNLRDHFMLMAQADNPGNGFQARGSEQVRDAAFDSSSLAQLVVDADGVLVLANERSRSLFSITQHDVGRPIQDLTVSYKPLELRSRLERAYRDGRAVAISAVEWPVASGDMRWFDVYVAPLTTGGKLLGASITFSDVTGFKRLQQELEHANQELEAAYEELQSTNEELETTNEELQSTVEELETTNEELQSSNEELETMNEELHSTNEELQTINDELRLRSDELNQANSMLAAILRSMRGGVVVVDRELDVLLWNSRAEDLWGLRREEVIGRNLLSLDVGLPVEQLKQPLRNALADASFAGNSDIPCINRRGRQVTCRVATLPLLNDGGTVDGAIITMEQLDGQQPERTT